MRAVVVYESMYGNTHRVAEAIGAGLRAEYEEVVVVPVQAATAEVVGAAHLIVVGGPTHAHGMSRPTTRKAAVDAAHEPENELILDEAADGPGVREWLDALGTIPVKAAAFDTRIHIPSLVSGRASHGISKALSRHGAAEICSPESFFVSKQNELEPGEERRAHRWGELLAGKIG